MRKYLLAACLLLMNTGFAKMEADRAARGGLLGHYNGDYIVRNDSGGVIMDVWVLEDRLVQNEDKSDGWYFVDNDGNVIHLGGDVKVIRVKDKSLLKKYREYHRELDKVPYEQVP